MRVRTFLWPGSALSRDVAVSSGRVGPALALNLMPKASRLAGMQEETTQTRIPSSILKVYHL